MQSDGPHAPRDSLDRRDDLLTEPVEEERVAHLHELRRDEAPLIVSTHEDRVLRTATSSAAAQTMGV